MDSNLQIILDKLNEIEGRLQWVEKKLPGLPPHIKVKRPEPDPMPTVTNFPKGTRDPSIPRSYGRPTPEKARRERAEKRRIENERVEADKIASKTAALDKKFYSNAGRNQRVVRDIVAWKSHPKKAGAGLLVALTALGSHAHELSRLLQPSGLRVAVLTEDTAAKTKKSVERWLQTGEVDILISDESLLDDQTFDCMRVAAWFWTTPLAFNTKRNDTLLRWLAPRTDQAVSRVCTYSDTSNDLRGIPTQLRRRYGLQTQHAFKSIVLDSPA